MINVTHNIDRINQHIDLGKLKDVKKTELRSFFDRNEVECLQDTRIEFLQQIMK